MDGPAKSQSPVENGGKHPIKYTIIINYIGFNHPFDGLSDFKTIHSIKHQKHGQKPVAASSSEKVARLALRPPMTPLFFAPNNRLERLRAPSSLNEATGHNEWTSG